VAARYRLYRAHMGSDHEAEIRASVGAHHDLGPGYEDAVAEGLVERIGAEIDKRIDARLKANHRPFGPPGVAAPPEPPEPGESAAAQGYPAPSAYPPGGYYWFPGFDGHPGYQGYQVPILPPGYPVAAPPSPAGPPEQRSAAQHSVAMTIIALGSMALGVAGTAIVAHATDGGKAAMVVLIWAAITIVNLAYARRC
jgi:hypothetical protein